MRFSTDDHTGYGGARMGKISNGTQQYFGPTYTTDDSDSEPEVYDGPANTPPAGAIPESVASQTGRRTRRTPGTRRPGWPARTRCASR